MKLSSAPSGQKLTVIKIGDVKEKERLRDLGFTVGVIITVINKAPLKGPVEIELKGFRLAVRYSLAEKVIVECVYGKTGDSSSKNL